MKVIYTMSIEFDASQYEYEHEGKLDISYIKGYLDAYFANFFTTMEINNYFHPTLIDESTKLRTVE